MKNYRVMESQLKQKLQAGTATREDLPEAIEVARALGSLSSRAMYSKIKQQVELNEAKETDSETE